MARALTKPVWIALIATVAILSYCGETLAQADAIAALNERISELHAAGKYAEAIPLAEKSLELTRAQKGEDSPDTAARMWGLASLYGSQDRDAEAEPLYQRSLAITEKALGPEHPDVGFRLGVLALIYYAQGRYAEAEPLYQRELAIIEKALGPEHPDVASGLDTLALLYSAQGRYAEAEPFYQRALAIAEKALGPEHADVGTRLDNLAGLYRKQGRYAEAEPLYQRALAIGEKALGPEHAHLGIRLNNLALLYYAQGRYAEAEPLYQRALAIAEKARGPEHPSVGTGLNNMADLYRAQGRYAEAVPLYQRAVAIGEQALGPEHPDVGTSLDNLAQLYRAQGRYAEAEPLYQRALAITEKALGAEHPDLGTRLNNLAGLYYAQSRYAEAEPLYQRALAIGEKALGPEHPDVGIRLNNLALLCESQGRYAEAEPLYQRALAIGEKALGPEHPHLAIRLDNLAGFYRRTGRTDEAARLEVRVKAMPPPGTRHLQVHFATNRKQLSDGSATKIASFGAEEADTLTLGHAVVRIPAKELQQLAKRREEGVGALHRSRGELTVADKLQIVRVRSLEGPVAFAASASQTLAHAGLYKGQAIVFVHGYNVGFEEALKRAAQIAFDLELDGLLVPFAWPSQRRLTQYLSDTESADVAVGYLIKLLDTFAEQLPATKVHFIAHSMGNLVLLRALERIAERRGAGPRMTLGELILAHADIDASRCAQLIHNVRPAVAGITLYVNTSDWALWTSERLRRKGRCGALARVYDGADTIDTTGMKAAAGRTAPWAAGWNHDAFVRVPLLFGEITRLLLTSTRPPEERTPELAPVKNAEGKIYWRFEAARMVAQKPAGGGTVLETK